MKIRIAIVTAQIALFATATVFSQTNFTSTNFFNWESAAVHPIALSPDGTKLAVCNLPAARVEVFDVTSGAPVALGSIPVGLDPVTARFRTGSELWVANLISDSISIVDVSAMQVVNTLSTSNGPLDIVFAGTPQRAYVSCGQPNLVQVYNPSTLQAVTNLTIDGNLPRAMDISPDGTKVYVAIFESGNASTIIGTGVSTGSPRANPVNFPNTPSGGQNPPPNNGTNFLPAINPALTNPPPKVGLIVKKNSAARWMDDNNGDWTEYIRGSNAAFTGRLPGWDMPDRDLAVIDTSNFSLSYARGLMNICMAVGVNPASGKICVVGTDALNNTRFQPALAGIFIRVNLAQVDPLDLTAAISDLNPHLTYQTSQVSDDQRNQSIGDPRGIVWSSDGQTGYVAGMGSDNVIVIDSQGKRASATPIDVGAGATGLALDETHSRLYVYNRFDDSVSTVDTTSKMVLQTLPLFDPTPSVIKLGRPLLYNTHRTSGLGQLACASCHVDARTDRLAWDLGDPTDVVKVITNANFANFTPAVTNNYHPMKGPMVTLTMQDIIGHEPFHWRGDRDGLEEFDATFMDLQGSTIPTTNDMATLKNFLATIRFGPNPFRNFDNSLPVSLPIPGQLALGRGTLPAGAQLPNGNAQNGQILFRAGGPPAFSCIGCHTLPTGLGTDMRFNGFQWVPVPLGSNSNHHAALVELPRSLDLPFKVPSLRNLFDKFGMDLTHTNSRSGFGFSHDGSVDSLTRFIQDGFGIDDDKTTADLVAFLISFTGSDLVVPVPGDPNRSPGELSLDTPASVGRQITISNAASVPLLDSMIALAQSATSRVDLIVKGSENGLARGWFYNRTNATFQSDRQSETESPAALRALAAANSLQTYTVVPRGAGVRMGIDRNANGTLDRDEMDSTPIQLTLTTDSAAVDWQTFAGFTYQLQYKNDLADTNWVNLSGGQMAITNGSMLYLDAPPGTNDRRFYRAVPLP